MFKMHLMLWIIVSQSPLVTISNWNGKNVLQKHWRIKNIKCGLWMNIMFPPLQWDELHNGLVMAKRWATPRTCAIWGEMWPSVAWYDNKIETTKGINLLNLLNENDSKGVQKPSQKDHFQ